MITQAYSLIVAAAKIHELHFELFPHPPYSPNLLSKAFALFSYYKNWFSAQKLESNEEAFSAVSGYFVGLVL